MENTDLCKNNLPLIHDNANGFSLLETVIAISLITLAASVTIQTIYISDTTQINATIAQRDWAEMTNLSAYIHKAFNEDRLVIDNITFQLVDTDLPDFIPAESLEIRPIAGTQTRYLDNQPACVLTENATLSPAEIAFTTDCLSTDNGSSISQATHTVWQQGAPIIFGIAGSSGLCVQQSAPSQTDDGMVAYLMVRDADCLQDANGTPSQIEQEILFPRFMVFSKDFPDQFHFALFEPIAHQTEGATLALPEMLKTKTGLATHITDVTLSALLPNMNIVLNLFTQEEDAQLWIENDYDADIDDNNSSNLTITGTISQIQRALEHLYYQSDDGFFGEDILFAEMRIHQHLSTDQTMLDIAPNCGDQDNGTAVRFDLGYFENDNFVLTDYLTSVTVVADFPPQRYYGYCRHSHSNTRPRHIYDQQSGLRRLVADPFTCSNIEDPSDSLTRYFATSSTAIEFDAEDRLTVFIYEEESRYSRDRFSLFFIFGDFGNDCGTDTDDGGDWAGKCEAVVSLSNVEAGRDLEDIEDIFTFADDPGEYAGDDGTAIISDTGIITMSPKWANAHDGLVVPLRLPDNDNFSADNLPELLNYAQDPDNDGQINPTLELVSTDTMHQWRIRNLDQNDNTITMRELPFNLNDTDERSVIQLNVGQSRRCETNDD